jgi:hypothetical protein
MQKTAVALSAAKRILMSRVHPSVPPQKRRFIRDAGKEMDIIARGDAKQIWADIFSLMMGGAGLLDTGARRAIVLFGR